MVNATVKEIAEKAGVHYTTVSRVMRGDQKGAWASGRKRAQQIHKIAREMGYRPNTAARAMVRGRLGCVGLLVSAEHHGRSTLPPQMLRGISGELECQRMQLAITSYGDENQQPRNTLPQMLRELNCDGLIIDYTKSIPQSMVDTIERHRIPSIWLNTKRPMDCVYPDDVAGGRLATQTLIDMGHTRIAYLTYSRHREQEPHYSEIDRYEGYAAAMNEAGLRPWRLDRYDLDAPTYGQRIGVVAELLRRPDRPTAFVSYGGGEVSSLMMAAERVGLSIPRDLSVVTFGEAPVRSGFYVATVVIANHQVGVQAVELLMEKLANPQRLLSPVAVPPVECVAGETLAEMC